jgi:hypothetical protein
MQVKYSVSSASAAPSADVPLPFTTATTSSGGTSYGNRAGRAASDWAGRAASNRAGRAASDWAGRTPSNWADHGTSDQEDSGRVGKGPEPIRKLAPTPGRVDPGALAVLELSVLLLRGNGRD